MIIRALELRAELLIVKPDGNLIDNLGSFGYMIDQKRGRCFMAFVPLQLQNLLEDSRGYNLLAMAGSIIIGGAAVSAQLEKQIKEIMEGKKPSPPEGWSDPVDKDSGKGGEAVDAKPEGEEVQPDDANMDNSTPPNVANLNGHDASNDR